MSEFITCIKQCSKARDLEGGKKLHLDAVAARCHTDKYVAAALITMYSKCGSMARARNVFDTTTYRDVVTWTSLILGYVENRQSSVALDLFTDMDCEPNSVAYVAALKASASLASEREADKELCLHKGIAIHERVKECGCDCNMLVASALLDMYAKCGSMQCARKVFQGLVRKDVVTWNCLILGYVHNGNCSVALDLFAIMDCQPTAVTYVAALKACAGLAMEREPEKQLCLEKGIAIHRRVKESGFDTNVLVVNSLLHMYGKCGSMHHAREVFRIMIRRDVVSWSTFILACVENGESSAALDLLASLDCEADPVLYIAALKVCSGLAMEKSSEKHFCLDKAISIHNQLAALGLDSDLVLASALIDTYGKCGSMQCAREVFDRMICRNVVTWNSLLVGYVDNGNSPLAIDLFTTMDCEPDNVTYDAVLKACVSLAMERESEKQSCLEMGAVIHRQINDRGFHCDTVLITTLMDLFNECGRMQHAMDLFVSMVCEPDCLTYVAALKACGGLAGLQAGQSIHARLCRLGLESEQVVANALVDFYGKCSSMNTAQVLFNSMHSPDIVSWTALIAGYSSVGDSWQVFILVESVQGAGLQLNSVSFICILTACSHAGLVEEAKVCFESMSKHGVKPTVEHYNCMVDMLGRANRLEEAISIVNGMPLLPNAVTWTTLLGACRKWNNLGVAKLAFDALLADETKDAAAYVLMSDVLTVCHEGRF